MTSPPRAIPGRWFTIAFGILLAVAVVVGLLTVVRFQKIMTALDDVRRLWPRAAVALEDRYRQVDQILSIDSTITNSKLSFASEAWRSIRQSYLASTQYDVQAPWVDDLEAISDQVLSPSRQLQGDTNIDLAIRDFIVADRMLETLQSGTVGWLTMQVFRLKIPSRLHSILMEGNRTK